MTETLMTEAATTTEGQASQVAAETTEQSAAPAAEQQATQEQTTEQQPGVESEGEQASQEEKPGAPEQYEFTAPEGIQLDDAQIAQFSEVAKELNLSQEAAQKIVEKMAPAMQARQTEVLNQARQEWRGQVQSDQEIGGDRLNENLAVAKKAMDTFGTPALRELLNKSGLGDHPEFVRFVYRAGKAISEDGFVPGGRASAAPADPAKRLFPNQA